MSTLKTNEIKKGDIVLLSNGWLARMEDSKRGDVRSALVYGTYTEMVSIIYAHDIHKVKRGEEWVLVEHTEDQKRLKASLERIFNAPKPQPKTFV